MRIKGLYWNSYDKELTLSKSWVIYGLAAPLVILAGVYIASLFG